MSAIAIHWKGVTMSKKRRKKTDSATGVVYRPERFAVVMAGGDGRKMLQMTKRITGCDTPKQFCSMLGEQTLVSLTANRIAQKIPASNIYYSLTKSHERYYRPLLHSVPLANKIVQPCNRGTVPAMIYALLRLRQLNPEARVAFFPSDHYVSDDEMFMNQIETAYEAVESTPGRVVIVGIEPVAPKSSYGWIEPAVDEVRDQSPVLRPIKRFWDEPTTREAEELMMNGGLWNSLVIVGSVGKLLDMFRRQMPALYRLFCLGFLVFDTAAERMTLRTIYRVISPRDLSFEVLERLSGELSVLKASGFKWSDLGDPEDVLLKIVQLGLKNKVFPMAG